MLTGHKHNILISGAEVLIMTPENVLFLQLSLHKHEQTDWKTLAQLSPVAVFCCEGTQLWLNTRIN